MLGFVATNGEHWSGSDVDGWSTTMEMAENVRVNWCLQLAPMPSASLNTEDQDDHRGGMHPFRFKTAEFVVIFWVGWDVAMQVYVLHDSTCWRNRNGHQFEHWTSDHVIARAINWRLMWWPVNRCQSHFRKLQIKMHCAENLTVEIEKRQFHKDRKRILNESNEETN